MKCTLCNRDEYYTSQNNAIAKGWRFTDARGPGGNKYGVFCPDETTEAIAECVADHVERVNEAMPEIDLKSKKKKGAAE